jgi:threonine dehydrogenase-like Zn-dependent dehydrogenase
MMPKTTRAAVMHEYATPLVIEDVPLPGRLEPGAALVRITATTLCGTDAHLWGGRFAGFIDVALPMIGGHEMAGEVVAIDSDHDRDSLGQVIKPGARIVWSEAVCGHCYPCTVLRESVLCEHRGMGFLQPATRHPYVIGGMSEYVYVTPGAQRIIVPGEVEDTWAATAGCAVKTMLRAFRNGGGVPAGAAVVVQGSGPLGLFATAYARTSGAGTVITIGAPDDRLALAAAWGADHTISVEHIPDPEQRVELVRELTGGRGAALVLDFAGAPTANREGVLMCARKGAYVIVGIAGPDADPIPVGAVMGNELRVCGSMNGDISDLAQALDFLSRYRTRFDWSRMFTGPVGLSGATQALAEMERAAVIKPVINPALP